MPKFYTRGSFGRIVEAECRLYDPELVEVRMTADEYRNFFERINKTELEAKAAKADAENQKKEIKALQYENWELSKLKEKAEEEATAAKEIVRKNQEESSFLREQLKDKNVIIQNEKNLNANLIRIMRERANRARGIRPKTQHDGYIILESRQWAERYTEEVWDTEINKKYYNVSEEKRRYAKEKGYLRVDRKKAIVWKSTIQTPYDATIPIEEVEKRIEQEMKTALHDFGVESRLEPEQNGDFYDFGTNDDGSKKNVMYRWMYSRNCRTRLWEMEFFTPESLHISEDRLPPQKNKDEPKTKAAKTNDMPVGDSDLSENDCPDVNTED